jgi:hypothetical protein
LDHRLGFKHSLSRFESIILTILVELLLRVLGVGILQKECPIIEVVLLLNMR